MLYPKVKIVVINLDRSLERRQNMARQLSALGITFEFMRAVDGRLGEHLKYPNYSDRSCVKNWRRPLTPGEVGCFASHYFAWHRCVSTGESLVVLEDDVTISDDFLDAIEHANHLVKTLGYVRLSGIAKTPYQIITSINCDPWKVARFFKGPMGTQCYVISPDSARAFLSEARVWDQPVDNFMDSFWRHGVHCIGLIPFPVQHSMDINSEISWNGISPSEESRRKVWRPKRFAVRKYDDWRRILFNLRNPRITSI